MEDTVDYQACQRNLGLRKWKNLALKNQRLQTVILQVLAEGLHLFADTYGCRWLSILHIFVLTRSESKGRDNYKIKWFGLASHIFLKYFKLPFVKVAVIT